MRWIDVFGPPGVGKSTICDTIWHPHSIPSQGVTELPVEWQPFLDLTSDLLNMVHKHETYANCLGMVNRSYAKMAAVLDKDDPRVYIQTGFAQRGLGFGWRLEQLGKPLDLIKTYYELMPLGLGVVMLNAPVDVVVKRNQGRERQGENRAHMVPLMQNTLVIARHVLLERVRFLELDTTWKPQELKQELYAFRDHLATKAVHAKTA